MAARMEQELARAQHRQDIAAVDPARAKGWQARAVDLEVARAAKGGQARTIEAARTVGEGSGGAEGSGGGVVPAPAGQRATEAMSRLGRLRERDERLRGRG